MVSRRRFLSNTAIAAGALASTSAFPSLAGAAAPILNPRFGFASTTWRIMGYTDAQLTQYMQAAKAAGASTIRMDVDWSHVEANRGDRDYAAFDRIINTIVANGLSPLVILDYTPAWASATPVSSLPPGSIAWAPNLDYRADWRNFVAATVTRYKTKVSTWEIWNEPNSWMFWSPGANAANYTTILKDAYTTIKSIQSASTVISGGMAPSPNEGISIAQIDFVKGIYANGGKGYFDAIANHPYTGRNDISDPNRAGASGDGWDQTRMIHDHMVAMGDSAKKIWVTEFGFQTGSTGNFVTEAQQATLLVNGLRTMLATPWIGKAFVYSLVDTGTNKQNPEENFGVIRADASYKPAYGALKSFTGN